MDMEEMMDEVEMNSENLLKKLVVYLPRVSTENADSFRRHEIVLDRVIQCPGCLLFFSNEENCAQHILQQCLKIRNATESDADREKIIKWICEYFYEHFVPADYEMNAVDEASFCKISNGNPQVQLSPIPFGLQCAVCEKYFCSATSCFEHLFRDCLYTENSDSAVDVEKWFFQFMASDSQVKLDFISSIVANGSDDPSLERVLCKYCKKELLDKDCMLTHFRNCHRAEYAPESPVCSFCNFKPLTQERLVKHLIAKHVKCGCGVRRISFNYLSQHLSLCSKRNNCVCPTCHEACVASYDSESSFGTHLLNCRKPVPLNLGIDDLYTQCDICWQHILKYNLDVHVAKHIKLTDSAKRQQKNTLISLADLKNMVSDQEFFKIEKLFN